MFKVLMGILFAALGWGFAFNGPFNFWISIFFAALVIFIYSLTDKRTLRIIRPEKGDLIVGLLSGLILFFLFLGISITLRYFFPDMYVYVDEVKSLKRLAPPYQSFPITLFVSISEEMFWRGYVQRKFMEIFGKLKGYVFMILAYVFAHIFTLNISLAVAALGAGLVWGFVFVWKKDLTPVIISHITWDVMLFFIGL